MKKEEKSLRNLVISENAALINKINSLIHEVKALTAWAENLKEEVVYRSTGIEKEIQKLDKGNETERL